MTKAKSSSLELTLTLLPERFTICRLPSTSPLPAWVFAEDVPLWSLTRTPDEIAVVCVEGGVPPSVTVREDGWRAFRVKGPLPFDTVGIISGLTAPLAQARVPVFVLSTFDTDHVLVRGRDLERAIAALESKFEVIARD